MDGASTIIKHHRWLLELTGLPTAAGREDGVIEWVRAWARRRPKVLLRADRYGNLELRCRGRPAGRQPLYFTAHMDHPAFVVVEATDRKTIVAEFRGGVQEEYFAQAKVLLHRRRGDPQRGTVRCRAPGTRGAEASRWQIHFASPVKAMPGDLITWDVGPARVRKGRLHAPACDDLAGVAAAVCAYDIILRQRTRCAADVRLFLTRAEEVGFVGAIGAAKTHSVSKDARVITLEASRSFPESPIGGGPIVRVGDRTSIFDSDLTYRISRVAENLKRMDGSFRWQRRLMPGGTCEASAFQAYGFKATCICLALGNYHNMSWLTSGHRRIAAEMIGLADFQNLVRLLVAVASGLDASDGSLSLRTHFEKLFSEKLAAVRLRPSLPNRGRAGRRR